MFRMTAKQWLEANPDLKSNIRSLYASAGRGKVIKVSAKDIYSIPNFPKRITIDVWLRPIFSAIYFMLLPS